MLGLNTAAYRLFRGRLPGPTMLLLTTVGAKSGAERTVPLQYFSDGPDAWVIVASAGGDAKHPAWYRNLAANPDRVWIEVGDRRIQVRPQSLRGEERAERWRRITEKARNFAGYERTTDREIPVVRLTPVEQT
ncbi:MAG TPA: nitroreductase/quinone reductase family protein [Candidatus Dormibacteraeota bacterium]